MAWGAQAKRSYACGKRGAMRRPWSATNLSRLAAFAKRLSPGLYVPVVLFSMIVLGALIALVPQAVLLMLVGLPIGIGLVMFPEVTLALYLNAGAFKADPRFQPISTLIDPTVALALILLVGVAYRLVVRKGTILWSKEASLAIALALVVLVSSAYTPAPGYGQEKAVRFITLTMLAFVVPLVVVQNSQELYRFLLGIMAIGLVLALEGLLEGGVLFTAFGSNTLELGYGAGIAILIVMFLILPGSRSVASRAAAIVIVGVLTWAMIGSGSRGPLQALAVSMVMTFLLSLVLRYRRRFALISIVAVAGIVLFVFSSALVPSASLARFRLLLSGGETQAQTSSAGTRLFYWRQSLALLSEHPLVGGGAGAFARFVLGVDTQEYPHNILLELASETGLVGLTIFVCLLLSILQRLLFALHISGLIHDYNRSLLFTVFALLTFELVGAMLSGDLNDGRGLWALFGVTIAVSSCVSRMARRRLEPSDDDHKFLMAATSTGKERPWTKWDVKSR
jgi:O-antigen ligase